MNRSDLTGFEWNHGNIEKNYLKHGITTKEAEELFLDENLLQVDDVKHSQKEKRFIAIGVTTLKKMLFAVFMVRNHKIRIISVRYANIKERRLYEKKS